jgi:Ca2+-binding EF-hand superfamily protein
MSTKFAQSVLKELNKFRTNPRSIQRQCELVRKGFSRIRHGDPFLKEIDYFIQELQSMNNLPALELNDVLTEAAKQELPNFVGKSTYKKYRRSDDVRGIVPDLYMVASPAMVADDGADEPINVLTKVLLDKQDRFKEGRNILCDAKFTQVGIAHEVFEEENWVVCIFATRFVDDEPEYDLPKQDLTELKKAFDILDANGNGKLDMIEIKKAMDDMRFYQTDPDLYAIFKELAESDKCSWPKFANIVNKKLTDRKTTEGLETIFSLFIDNPDKETMSFSNFKKISNELDAGISEQELKNILDASTQNGKELTFEEFEEYMKSSEK